jgi:hypothetical protein
MSDDQRKRELKSAWKADERQKLRNDGGFCDCEVILNVDEKFGKMVGR